MAHISIEAALPFLFGVALFGLGSTLAALRRPCPPRARPEPHDGAPSPRSESDTLTSDDDGTIRSEFAIASGQRLRLVGRPIRDGNQVLVTLLGGNGQSTPLAQCTEVRVIVDGSEQSLSDLHPVPGTTSALQAIVAPGLLQSLGAANRVASVVPCGTSWQILPDARALLLKFVARFRETAERYGTWTPNEVVDDRGPRRAAAR